MKMESNFLVKKVHDALRKNPPKKTRYARGMTAHAARKIWEKSRRNLVVWAMNLKPGDTFNSFDGMNHVVKETKIIWGRYGRIRNGRHVISVDIVSTDGYIHGLDEWWCIVPEFTPKEIEQFFTKPYFDKLIELGLMNEKGFRLRAPTEEEQEIFNKMAGCWCGIG